MDGLKNPTGLGQKSAPIQPRDTTLGSVNNVLSPNVNKLNLVNDLTQDEKDKRADNITHGNGSNMPWWTTNDN